MKKILIIEDNESIIKGIEYLFENEGFEVEISQNIQTAKELLNKKDFNIILLDITLPDGNGFELCKFIKENTNIPVVILTAKDEETDIILGFDLGAEEYITKPFKNKELIYRVNNILKRNINKEIIRSGNITIYISANRIYKENKEINLTSLEFKIVSLLFLNIGKTIKRETILEKIWDNTGNFVNDNTLTVSIKRIREKLEEDIIKTIKGIGYRIDENQK